MGNVPPCVRIKPEADVFTIQESPNTEGKYVIRPIAFKPVPQANNESQRKDVSDGRSYPVIPARPDPRYTSTPTLVRGQVQHYGSMGDLKTLSHNSSYSLDRRSGPLPSNGPIPVPSKYNTLIKSYANKPTNKVIKKPDTDSLKSHNSPPYPPPPRPQSHQSSCSTVDENSYRCFDSRLSSTHDQSYDSMQNTPISFAPSRSTSGYDTSHASFNGSDLPRVESMKNLSAEEGFPQGYNHPRIGGSVSNLSRIGHHSGSVQGLDRSMSVNSSNMIERGSNFELVRGANSSVTGSLSELRLHNHHQTPSPSDSGVAELEAMLKEKDTEISSLKENMEKNEQVIFKVYEQKEKAYERELKKIRDMYDSRLKAAQQKALKVEQTLTTQTYQLQQERRKLTAELEEAKREKDNRQKQVDQLKKENTSLRSQLEETEWGLCQKSGEISLLKTQLKDSQGDQTTRGHELLHLRAQVRQYQQEIERRRAEITSLHDLTSQLRRDNAELRRKLDRVHINQEQDKEISNQKEKVWLENETHRREFEIRQSQFKDERQRWQEEKERVLIYHKQLQHNYYNVMNRNRQLEEEVARLTGGSITRTVTKKPVPNIPQKFHENGQPNTESRC